MSGELAWFPMTAQQATAVQRRCAEAMGLLLVEQLELGQGKAIDLVLIPAGEFLMGGQDDDAGHAPRQVRFPRPFYLSRYPVTQAQWTAVMDTNPAHFRDCPDCPIENVAWEAIVAFCAQASAWAGRRVRLPSEAEWEYACRAGSDTTYCFGNSADQLDHYGWYRDNSGTASHPVGGKRPNAWGLYDLHGGIDEFVRDNWHETLDDLPGDGSARIAGGAAESRTLRGGSWYDLAEYCTSGHRNYYRYDAPSEDHGFRVAVEMVLGAI